MKAMQSEIQTCLWRKPLFKVPWLCPPCLSRWRLTSVHCSRIDVWHSIITYKRRLTRIDPSQGWSTPEPPDASWAHYSFFLSHCHCSLWKTPVSEFFSMVSVNILQIRFRYVNKTNRRVPLICAPRLLLLLFIFSRSLSQMEWRKTFLMKA